MKNSFTITNDIYLYIENTDFLISYLEDSLERIVDNDVPFPIDYFAIIYENYIDFITVFEKKEINDAWSAYLDDVEYEKYAYGTGLDYKDFLIECINNETFRQTYFN